MMTIKEVDNMFLMLSKFREDVRELNRLKCLERVELQYHTGHKSTSHSNGSPVFLEVRAVLMDNKKNALLVMRDQLSQCGVDVTSEMPRELQHDT